MEREIYKKIKENDIIVLARHIGPDPDALGSTIGLKEIIKNTFPEKKVYVVGSMSSKFKFIGEMDKVSDEIYKDALLIVCDTPNIKRIDGIDDISVFKDIIKIDHHPKIDYFGSIEWIDDTKSSVCQMIIELTYKTRLKMNKYAAERLFMGLVSDTDRFLYDYTTNDTMRIVSKLLDDTNIDFTSLYYDLYKRPLSDIRLLGYMYDNIVVTENGLGYLKITDEILQKYNADAASGGNLVNNFNNIEEILVWVTFTEDVKQGLIRVNARSRGPIINKVLENHNGGGHIYSSGTRITDKNEVDQIIKELDMIAKKYKKENSID